tara:strand:- start:1030 stop:1749 length:720 start_codon:yes stop_codon:yes gene_type:complete
MASSSNEDPLGLAELDPIKIQAKIDVRDKKVPRPPSELELQKEARLAEKEKRLTSGATSASGGKKAPVPSEVPPPAPQPPKDRSVLLDKITAYRERFPHLKKRNNLSGKSTIEEIEDELHYCELQLGSQSGGQNLGATVLFGTMLGIEKLTNDYWNPLGLNLTGLGTVTQQNMSEFQPILDELMIKHNAGVYTSPEWRLALAIGATVITVNAANQNPEMARAVKSMNMAVNKPPGSADL